MPLVRIESIHPPSQDANYDNEQHVLSDSSKRTGTLKHRDIGLLIPSLSLIKREEANIEPQELRRLLWKINRLKPFFQECSRRGVIMMKEAQEEVEHVKKRIEIIKSNNVESPGNTAWIKDFYNKDFNSIKERIDNLTSQLKEEEKEQKKSRGSGVWSAAILYGVSIGILSTIVAVLTYTTMERGIEIPQQCRHMWKTHVKEGGEAIQALGAFQIRESARHIKNMFQSLTNCYPTLYFRSNPQNIKTYVDKLNDLCTPSLSPERIQLVEEGPELETGQNGFVSLVLSYLLGS